MARHHEADEAPATPGDQEARNISNSATAPTTAGARQIWWSTLALLMLALGLWNLDGPAMWWDEGWTLSVARHWAEGGHYGRLRDGQLARPGLEAAFTTTLPVGLTMRALGVGLWQGRLFGVVCAVVVTLLLAALAARLYDGRVATATAAVALLMTAHPQIHPLLQGRQVLAELPMLAYLLAGYYCLWLAMGSRRLAVVPAALLLGAAWFSKGQTGPFLAASLAAPLAIALVLRRWKIAALAGATLAGAYAVARLVPPLVYGVLIDQSLPADPVEGLLGMVAVVLTPFHRGYALGNLLTFGLPALLGLLWGAWRLWRERATAVAGAPQWYLRLTLLAFCVSWLGWFAALSVGVPRYMAPPVVVASIFVAALLSDLTGGFAIGDSVKALTNLLTMRRPTRAGYAALAALALTTGAITLTALSLVVNFNQTDRSAQRVATMLNAMPAGTRVETYESELHFLLEQPYTFPPDQLHVALGMRSLLVDEEAPVIYDPLVNDPAYLVVGRFARENELYEPAIASGAFRLVAEDGLYELYERAR